MTPSSVVSHTCLHRNQESVPGQFQESVLLYAATHIEPFQHHGERPAAVCIGSQAVLTAAFSMDLIVTHIRCVCATVYGLLVH